VHTPTEIRMQRAAGFVAETVNKRRKGFRTTKQEEEKDVACVALPSLCVFSRCRFGVTRAHHLTRQT